MTRLIDPNVCDQLSAYLDGALSPTDAAEVEHMLATHPAIAAEFDALSRVDLATRTAFDSLLADPVPMSLARVVAMAPAADRPNSPPGANLAGVGGWRAVAAAAALLVIGGAGGAYLSRTFAPAQAPAATAWLDQVAAYQLIYAAQKKHLVEVPASETEDLQNWLSTATGVAFTVPDLSANGLTFQGGRLLVASGKPVAQLMYTTAAGQVVAVCLLAGGDADAGAGITPPTARPGNGVNMVWWSSKDASYVVVGPTTGIDLQSVAKTAAIAL